MKQSDIQVGKKYMLSLGRRGARAVNVLQVEPTVQAVDSSHSVHICTARRLSPCPVTDRDGNLLGYAHEMSEPEATTECPAHGTLCHGAHCMRRTAAAYDAIDKPWAGEFPVDRAEGMDDAAVRILRRNMEAGRARA